MNTFATIIQEQIPVVSKQKVLNNSMLLFLFLPSIVAMHAKGEKRLLDSANFVLWLKIAAEFLNFTY